MVTSLARSASQKLERSPLPRLSREKMWVAQRLRVPQDLSSKPIGLHRQSCSSVFHSYILFKSFTAPKSENKRKTNNAIFSETLLFYFFLLRSLKA
jgi:hypothetical protein